MDEFRENLYRACQQALHRTTPPGKRKHNFAWHTDGWFIWEIERRLANPLTGKADFEITESVEFILGGDAGAFYKIDAYTTGIKGRKNHVRTFDFEIASEDDLAKLDIPLPTLLRARQDPLYGSLNTIRLDKAIATLHEQVIKAVLEPVAHEELHTDIGAYDESIAEVASTDSFPGWGGGAMTREEFAALRVGDRFLNTDDKHVYTVTQINCNGIGVGIIAVRDDKQGPGKEHGCYFWRTSIDAMSPLPPVEHEELHTDVDAYDESLWQDEKIISSLKEKPLTSKMEENIVNSESSEEKIPYWKTIDPEHPKNETERRAFAIVEETSRDPEYAKVSKR